MQFILLWLPCPDIWPWGKLLNSLIWFSLICWGQSTANVNIFSMSGYVVNVLGGVLCGDDKAHEWRNEWLFYTAMRHLTADKSRFCLTHAQTHTRYADADDNYISDVSMTTSINSIFSNYRFHFWNGSRAFVALLNILFWIFPMKHSNSSCDFSHWLHVKAKTQEKRCFHTL